MNALRSKSWSPYAVGAGIGVLSWWSFASAGKGIGITTAFEHTAAMLYRAIAPVGAAANSYFSSPERTPRIGWEWMLVFGVFIGAYISSKLSGDRGASAVPGLWKRRFGAKASTRFAGAFLGGALMMFGARLAGGCTSGHGISGTLQLAVASWLFVPVLFLSGIAVATVLYGGRGGKS